MLLRNMQLNISNGIYPEVIRSEIPETKLATFPKSFEFWNLKIDFPVKYDTPP